MLAGSVRAYVNRFGVQPGREVLLFMACDNGWAKARDLVGAGARLSAVVDSRSEVDPEFKAVAKRAGALRRRRY